MATSKSKDFDTFDPQVYQFPECRDGHEWKWTNGSIDDQGRLGYQIDRCKRCGTRRHSIINLDYNSKNYGLLDRARRYVHPDGYLVPGGLDKFDKGKLRVGVFLKKVNGLK
jgi:hypothetical protein